MSTLFSAALFMSMTIAYVFGGFQLASYATGESPIALGLAFASYVAANVMLVMFLRNGAYGVLMITSSLAVLLGNTVISAFILREHYTALQGIGVALAIISVVLVGCFGKVETNNDNQPTRHANGDSNNENNNDGGDV